MCESDSVPETSKVSNQLVGSPSRHKLRPMLLSVRTREPRTSMTQSVSRRSWYSPLRAEKSDERLPPSSPPDEQLRDAAPSAYTTNKRWDTSTSAGSRLRSGRPERRTY